MPVIIPVLVVVMEAVVPCRPTEAMEAVLLLRI